MLDEQLFQADHDGCRLDGMASGANTEIDIGLRKAQFTKENLRHLVVVMLASVNQHLLNPASLEGSQDRRRLRKIRPSTSHMDNGAHGDLS